MSPGRPIQEERQAKRLTRGFTLVELLVVVLIIGILAAIALPRLLGQRTRAKNAAAQAAARHALLAARSYYTQNSESYVGLGPTQLQGYESSLGTTEPGDGQTPGSTANPQNIWIGNGLDGTNPNTAANGDPNGGNTVVLCSVSKGDTTYCVKDVNGVATYSAVTGSSVLVAAGSTYTASGWSSSVAGGGVSPAVSSNPTITGTATEGQDLTGNIGSWTGSPTLTYAWVWRRCNSSGASCADITGASGSGSSVGTYRLANADVGKTIRLQVAATSAGVTVTADSNQTAAITGIPSGSWSTLAQSYSAVAAWPLADADTSDTSGNNRPLTAVNAASLSGTDGPNGSRGTRFATNGSFSRAHHADFSVASTDNFTWEFWVRAANMYSYISWLNKQDSPVNYCGNYEFSSLAAIVETYPAGSLGLRTRNAWASFQVYSDPMISNVWHQIVVTSASGALTIYVDGAQVRTGTAYNPLTTNTAPVKLGTRADGGVWPFDMARVAMYRRILTAAQISALYAS